jgi:hypothetical protein
MNTSIFRSNCCSGSVNFSTLARRTLLEVVRKLDRAAGRRSGVKADDVPATVRRVLVTNRANLMIPYIFDVTVNTGEYY